LATARKLGLRLTEIVVGQVFFYLGGAKSGKTKAALAAAEAWPGPRVYLATAQARDEEMRARIEAHQAERGRDWRTVETPLDPAGAILSLKGEEPVLLDCLTLWVSNLLEAASPPSLETVAAAAARLLAVAQDRLGPTFVVSGEVGLGLVPMEPLSRFYRDALGVANQIFAAGATEAYLMVAGRKLKLE
jgi:adenosylcobinamide kinase/adenosylcobinamide-phosphate guanylyltransferase